MHFYLLLGILCFTTKLDAKDGLENYYEQRNGMLEARSNSEIGGNLRLSEKELRANNILMEYKDMELNSCLKEPAYFNFSKNYVDYRHEIPKSKVYQIIRKMPKGALLHCHSSLMLDADKVLELTYSDNLFACITNKTLVFRFSLETPQLPCASQWRLLSDIRNKSGDLELFDQELKKHFTFHKDEDLEWGNIKVVWDKFNRIYYAIKSLISYRPVRERFYTKVLQFLYDDQIRYLEMRTGIHELYELNGTVLNQLQVGRLYKELTDKFIETHPDFIGTRLILTSNRKSNPEKIQDGIKTALLLKNEIPDFVIGYDLVGEEDAETPLKDFIPVLTEMKEQIDYYFHAGETNWLGTTIDENIYDAVLLGTKRIGHAYALPKHPQLMSQIIEKDICIEVNPISNVVLALNRDVREHPATVFLSHGVPVVLASDDPGVWGADPLSHDFYVTFVGIASRHSDLRMLKQLAMNSITYSALDERRKGRLFRVFHKQWDNFINDIINDTH